MIKHIVIWKLKDEVNGKSKSENISTMKKMLEDLVGKVPTIVSLKVEVKSEQAPANCDDIILISEFKTWEDLDLYANHPEHLKVVDFVKTVVEKRSAVDYLF